MDKEQLAQIISMAMVNIKMFGPVEWTITAMAAFFILKNRRFFLGLAIVTIAILLLLGYDLG
jgi:hypothetical protein